MQGAEISFKKRNRNQTNKNEKKKDIEALLKDKYH